LEQRVAGGDDDDRGEVAGDAEPQRHHGENERADHHSGESGEGHAVSAETVHNALSWRAGERGNERSD